MDEIELKNGQTLGFQLADFGVAAKLLKVVAAELLKIKVEVERLDPNLDVTALLKDPKAINSAKDVVCALLASEEVDKSFYACAAGCTLDGIRIDKTSFEDANARRAYLACKREVIFRNLGPFFDELKDLLSSSSAPEKPETSAAPT